jgi:hypothetical protein
MNQLKHFYDKVKKQCDEIGNKYDITLFQNVSDNVYSIIQSAEPTQEEKSYIWDLYHDYLYFENKEN